MDNNSVEVETLSTVPNNKKKNKILKIVLIIIPILLVLSIVGLIVYKEFILLDKKTIIKNSVSEIFNVLNTNIDNINQNILPFNANEESIGIDGTLELSSNYKDEYYDLTKLNNYSLKFYNALDLKNNKFSSQLNLNKDNNILLSLNNYIYSKYGLVESNQLSYYAYNYTLGKEIKDININNSNNYDNLKKIINRTRDMVLSKIDENKITRDIIETTINNQKANYTRFTYSVNINELTNDILKFYISDTSVLNTLSELTSTNSEDLKKIIQELINILSFFKS